MDRGLFYEQRGFSATRGGWLTTRSSPTGMQSVSTEVAASIWLPETASLHRFTTVALHLVRLDCRRHLAFNGGFLVL